VTRPKVGEKKTKAIHPGGNEGGGLREGLVSAGVAGKKQPGLKKERPKGTSKRGSSFGVPEREKAIHSERNSHARRDVRGKRIPWPEGGKIHVRGRGGGGRAP